MAVGIGTLDFAERIDFAWLEQRLHRLPPVS
jgi:hypothetical protein